MVTHAQLLKILRYSKATGQFTWLVSPRFNVLSGERAGCLTRRGDSREVWVICINGRNYSRGRLAWFYVTGKWPPEIDHKDCNRLNDRFDNLRPCSRSQNQQNTRRYKNNTTGFKGVFFDHATGRFRAQIQANNKRKDIGRYPTAEAAFAARTAALARLHGEFARAA